MFGSLRWRNILLESPLCRAPPDSPSPNIVLRAEMRMPLREFEVCVCPYCANPSVQSSDWHSFIEQTEGYPVQHTSIKGLK